MTNINRINVSIYVGNGIAQRAAHQKFHRQVVDAARAVLHAILRLCVCPTIGKQLATGMGRGPQAGFSVFAVAALGEFTPIGGSKSLGQTRALCGGLGGDGFHALVGVPGCGDFALKFM